MKCTASSSSKPTTCHIPTVLGTCTTGSWWPVWAALSCPAEGSCATSSSTSEGKRLFCLQLCFLLLCWSSTACCSYLSHPLAVQTSSCGVQPPIFAQFLPPAVLCIQTPRPLPPICCVKRMWNECTLPKQNTMRLCCSGFTADDLLLTNVHINIISLQEMWGLYFHTHGNKYYLAAGTGKKHTMK